MTDDILTQAADAAAAHPATQIPNSGGAPAPSGFHVDDFEKYAALAKTKKKQEADLKATKDKMAALEEPLLEQLSQSGMPQVKLDSGALISTRTNVTVKAGAAGAADENDWNAACDALESIGLGDFSKRRFLIPTLKKYVGDLKKEADAAGTEYEELGDLLPPELSVVLTVGTVTQISATGV